MTFTNLDVDDEFNENCAFIGYQTHPITRLSHKTEITCLTEEHEWVVEEVPVALVYNGIAHVVMMLLPSDLTYFAWGFHFPKASLQNDKISQVLMFIRQSKGSYSISSSVIGSGISSKWNCVSK